MSEVGAKLINIYIEVLREQYNDGWDPSISRQIAICWLQRNPLFCTDFGLSGRKTAQRGGIGRRLGPGISINIVRS